MTKEELIEFLHRLTTSGSTVKEYCKQKGIPMSTYCYWKRKLKDTEPLCGLVPVQVCSDCKTSTSQQSKSIVRGAMIIHFPNGVKVEFMQSEDSVGIGMLNHMCQHYVLPE